MYLLTLCSLQNTSTINFTRFNWLDYRHGYKALQTIVKTQDRHFRVAHRSLMSVLLAQFPVAVPAQRFSYAMRVESSGAR